MRNIEIEFPAAMQWISDCGKGAEASHQGYNQKKSGYTRNSSFSLELNGKPRKENLEMKLSERLAEKAATGYILLWLLGIPIPILFIVFLLRGCT